MLINATAKITLLHCCGSITTGSFELGSAPTAQVHIAAHNIFQCYKCQMPLTIMHLMSKSGILVPSLHELSPHFMKLKLNKEYTIKRTQSVWHILSNNVT